MEITTEVIKQIKNDDRATILKLYHHSYNCLIGIAVRHFMNEEDRMNVVNTAFMKVINSIGKFQPGTNYFAWIKTIMNNTIIDFYRKEKKYKSLFIMNDDEATLDALAETDYAATKQEIFKMEVVEKVLNLLPPATRLTFNLFAIDGYSYKEIAKKIDVSYETVKWHIKSARKMIRKQLNKSDLY